MFLRISGCSFTTLDAKEIAVGVIRYRNQYDSTVVKISLCKRKGNS